MKNQILSEEFRKMQKLAGIITESQYVNQINEMSIDNDLEIERKWKALDSGEKLEIIRPYADGGEADSFLNLGIGEMPSDMSDAIKDYFTMDYTSNPNHYTNDYEIERDKYPFGDDAMFESKKTKSS